MRNIPPLNWLRAFEVTARHGSFSLAAKELNVTQSAISQQVKNLENHLGCALFIRDAKQLQLTTIGNHYLPTVNQSFSQLAAATQSLFSHHPFINIRTDIAFATLFIAPRIAEFRRQYPEVQIVFENMIWWHHQPKMTGQCIEIRHGIGQWPEPCERLFNDQALAVSAPQLPDIPMRLDAFLAYPLFELTGVHYNWLLWLTKAGMQPINAQQSPVLIPMAADSSTLLYQFAKQGSGISLLSAALASYGLAKGEIKQAAVLPFAVRDSFYLIEPVFSLQPYEKAFIEWLLSICAEVNATLHTTLHTT
ncbi:LysR family transcriptional regulator [Ostreibacterium oceani]|uniref:LysR family transcriptional regulator n=1 Tax=Ostreibacterium oceani TaxID=2654998 RepID=A0A6N7ERN3_9GAMM|nr:LysR family transcriptional regulator [Ostreibacterium oceani]MPV85524.1 LysR family transcriptional regulator [Ostreibacterium oceani]